MSRRYFTSQASQVMAYHSQQTKRTVGVHARGSHSEQGDISKSADLEVLLPVGDKTADNSRETGSSPLTFLSTKHLNNEQSPEVSYFEKQMQRKMWQNYRGLRA